MDFSLTDREIIIRRLVQLWEKNNLKLDYAILDLQHLWLIWLLLILEEETLSSDIIEKENHFRLITSELVDFTLNHFAAEETIFDKYNFPEKEKHVKKHADFIEKVKHSILIGELKDPNKVPGLITFLKNWLYDHILKEDRQYKYFLSKKNIDINEFLSKRIRNQIVPIRIKNDQIKLYEKVTGLKFYFYPIAYDIATEVIKIWKAYNLGVSIPIIDMQHLWLIKLMAELEIAINSNSSVEEIEKIFKKVLFDSAKYIQEHFSAEELIMDQFKYPELENHKKSHAEFIEVLKMRNHQMKLGSKSTPKNLVIDLKNWLVSHIGKEDHKYKIFFKNHQLKLNEFIKTKIKDKSFVIHQGQLNLYSVAKVMLESD